MTEVNSDAIEARHEEIGCEMCEDTGRDIIDGDYCYCVLGEFLEMEEEPEPEEECYEL